MLAKKIIESSLVFQHVIENMHDGVLTIDYSGVITTVNPAAETILELKKDRILDKKLSDVFFEYPENDDFIQVILDAVYDASMSHHKVCGYYTGKRQKSLFVTTSFLKVKIDDAIESIGITVLFSDVTELGELKDAAAALDKIKALNEKLERLSYLDELTGLPNRRFFNDFCNREWRRMMRERKHIAYIMVDIDYFKEINDNYGHHAGDECITAVAKVLGRMLKRPSDLAARYGGDEFIVILPDTDAEGAMFIAEKLHKGISGLNIENACSPFGKLTVSIGAAAGMPEQGTHWKRLETAADEALYRAKQNGRNQISL
jgi:diguanylate cyclase (GGDEF)-like protein/PAS domain S-box-containing protein